MNKSLKTLTIVFVVLLVILIISVWAGSGKKPSNSEINNACKIMCRGNEDEGWMFRGQVFYSQEDCIATCQTSIK
jgi:hypothetical protein